MERRQETTVDDDGQELSITDTTRTPSSSEQTQSQDLQAKCPACNSSSSINDMRMRMIMKGLDDSLKESFRNLTLSLTNSFEKRFKDLESNVNKMQGQLKSIQQQLSVQNSIRRHDSLRSLQLAEDCCEDLEKQDEGSSESYANIHAYIQSVQRHQEMHGGRRLPLRPPSRVMRQRRNSSRYSLTYPFVTDTVTL